MSRLGLDIRIILAMFRPPDWQERVGFVRIIGRGSDRKEQEGEKEGRELENKQLSEESGGGSSGLSDRILFHLEETRCSTRCSLWLLTLAYDIRTNE